MKKFRSIVVSIYIHPEFYPPTINAILCLAEVCEDVKVVTRNNSLVEFPFPSNVKVIKNGKYSTPYDSERLSTVSKILSFLRFTASFLKVSRNKKTDLILLYDAIPLFSYFLVRRVLRKNVKIWYHNHDMPNIQNVRKYSIGWFSARYEFKAMEHIKFFSLPSKDRLTYYPLLNTRVTFFYAPNFPSLKVYSQPKENSWTGKSIRLIFQGAIGEHHAFEEILLLMKEPVDNMAIELVLKGPVRNKYKEKLIALAKLYNVESNLHWHDIGPYNEVPKLTRTCQIGIAIYMGKDEVSKTLGTASNKIYEYAACGLPVLLYDNEQFRKNLSTVDWAFFTDGSITSLKDAIQAIICNWSTITLNARKDFERSLNFEVNFNRIINQL